MSDVLVMAVSVPAVIAGAFLVGWIADGVRARRKKKRD